ncbi:MAG: FISUMP domain-containing protein [Bacteroidota bacterium]
MNKCAIITYIITLLPLFTCFSQEPSLDSFIDPRDGKVYHTIVINGKTWMAENLAFLPKVDSPSHEFDNQPHYYVYGYYGNEIKDLEKDSVYAKYGALYNWYSAIDACPTGWVLPTDEDWIELEKYLGMDASETKKYYSRYTGRVGLKLKKIGSWKSATDLIKFGVLPGGQRYYGNVNDPNENGDFAGLGQRAFFWTSSKGERKGSVIRRQLEQDSEAIIRFPINMQLGYSVRCIKK